MSMKHALTYEEIQKEYSEQQTRHQREYPGADILITGFHPYTDELGHALPYVIISRVI